MQRALALCAACLIAIGVGCGVLLVIMLDGELGFLLLVGPLLVALAGVFAAVPAAVMPRAGTLALVVAVTLPLT